MASTERQPDCDKSNQGQCEKGSGRGANHGNVVRTEQDEEYLRELEGQDDAGPVLAPAGSILEHMLTAQLAGLLLHLLLGDVLGFLHPLGMHMQHFC